MSSAKFDSFPQNSLNIRAEIAAVIDIEIEGLQAVRQNLTADFEKAVELIARCKGQVLVAGIGKSGIIARKIAATLRSTGTPAAFLHASDALHGDLGVVRIDDVVLAIGKSGESADLNELLRALKKNGNVIISMTSNSSSAMAQLSDVVLDLKIPREACPLNLAPTTSTTAALVIGDAIAVTLMKLKNVSAEDFARHHPGGQLGKRLLLTVADVMRKGEENPLVLSDSSVKDMLLQMTSHHVGAVSVIDKTGCLLGFITDYDIRRILESDGNILSMKIVEIMNTDPVVVYEDSKAIEALELMRRRAKPLAVLPVVNRAKEVVGVVHIHDLISAGL